MPYSVAILICDQVIVDEATQKKSLIGIFDRVLSQGFPTIQPVWVYAKVTDAAGEYRFRMEIAHVASSQALGHVDTEMVNITDRLAFYELIFRIGVPASTRWPDCT